MPDSNREEEKTTAWWRSLGPGFVVAATGVGAGDLIAAGVAGQRFGMVVLWAVALGAVFKAVLNEGISRWQLATGTTLIEGWSERLPRWVSGYFLIYLALWGFLVAAALSASCGVAAKALFPNVPLPVAGWSAMHAMAAYLLVKGGRYLAFEKLMKLLMGLMFVLVVVCAVMMKPPLLEVLRGLTWPTLPTGSAKFLLGVIGGVGGSVTLLCYGYWIREKGWRGQGMHKRSFLDLIAAYSLTGIFGLAVVIIAATAKPADASGNALVLALADQLAIMLGPFGQWSFLIGFWCAVFTSMLGVWQGVPYLFADSVATLGRHSDAEKARDKGLKSTPAYHWFLIYLAFPPLVFVLWQKPIAIVILYAIAGAFFMPFLASVLLLMNNRQEWVGELKNGKLTNVLLVLSLLLFGCLFFFEVWRRLGLA